MDLPAYFSISFCFRKNDVTGNLVHGFYESLFKCGLSFKSGYRGSEADTLEVIADWNQKKLDDNFELGDTEHYSHDYKQA